MSKKKHRKIPIIREPVLDEEKINKVLGYLSEGIPHNRISNLISKEWHICFKDSYCYVNEARRRLVSTIPVVEESEEKEKPINIRVVQGQLYGMALDTFNLAKKRNDFREMNSSIKSIIEIFGISKVNKNINLTQNVGLSDLMSEINKDKN